VSIVDQGVGIPPGNLRGSRALKDKSAHLLNIKKSNARILVMDDDDTIRFGLEVLLTELGYDVVSATDGEAAVKAYSDGLDSGSPFDIVILDLTIPGGMGGKEAIEKLRSLDPDITAIVSSGYATDPIMADCKTYGFKSVLPKPFRPSDLRTAIAAALER